MKTILMLMIAAGTVLVVESLFKQDMFDLVVGIGALITSQLWMLIEKE